jgi:hypothetical protein
MTTFRKASVRQRMIKIIVLDLRSTFKSCATIWVATYGMEEFLLPLLGWWNRTLLRISSSLLRTSRHDEWRLQCHYTVHHY